MSEQNNPVNRRLYLISVDSPWDKNFRLYSGATDITADKPFIMPVSDCPELTSSDRRNLRNTTRHLFIPEQLFKKWQFVLIPRKILGVDLKTAEMLLLLDLNKEPVDHAIKWGFLGGHIFFIVGNICSSEYYSDRFLPSHIYVPDVNEENEITLREVKFGSLAKYYPDVPEGLMKELLFEFEFEEVDLEDLRFNLVRGKKNGVWNLCSYNQQSKKLEVLLGNRKDIEVKIFEEMILIETHNLDGTSEFCIIPINEKIKTGKKIQESEVNPLIKGKGIEVKFPTMEEAKCGDSPSITVSGKECRVNYSTLLAKLRIPSAKFELYLPLGLIIRKIKLPIQGNENCGGLNYIDLEKDECGSLLDGVKSIETIQYTDDEALIKIEEVSGTYSLYVYNNPTKTLINILSDYRDIEILKMKDKDGISIEGSYLIVLNGGDLKIPWTPDAHEKAINDAIESGGLKGIELDKSGKPIKNSSTGNDIPCDIHTSPNYEEFAKKLVLGGLFYSNTRK